MSLPFAESSKALASTTSPDSVVTLAVSGFGGVGIQITGTFVGTLQFESSLDGVTPGAHSVTPPNSATAVTSATAPGRWSATCATHFFQVRMSAFTSGEAFVRLIGIPNGPASASSGGGGGGDATAANQVLQTADLDKLVAQALDYDTGAGTATQVIFGLALPASGGPVAGGTATNPIRVDPTGTTAQHVIADSGTITTVSAVTAISNALPAGSNVIGHVITDTGSTTAVTGTVTVTGGLTDTQLRASAVPVTAVLTAGAAVIGHVIADSGSTTAVTGNVTVVQATGTSLHAVLDTTSTTAVTQATATNLNAAVVGTGTAGSAVGGVLTVQGVASMTKLLVTPDSVALPANQSVNVAQINGVTPLMGAGNTGTGSPRVTIATDQATVPVSLASLPALVAGTAIIGSVKRAGFQNASWAVNHAPAANTKATITQASAGGSTKNVCTGLTVSLAAGASAPTAIQLSVALIDGVSGGTTYLWGPTVISLPAVAGAVSAFAFGQRWDVGTAATAMTLEFSVAGGTNTIESVSMSGTTTL